MKKAILGLLGVVAAVGIFAYVSTMPSEGSNFLSEFDEFTEIEKEFVKFLAINNRKMHNKYDYMFRLSVFAKNYKFIEDYNSMNHSVRLAVNYLADWTDQEYEKLLGLKD